MLTRHFRRSSLLGVLIPAPPTFGKQEHPQCHADSMPISLFRSSRDASRNAASIIFDKEIGTLSVVRKDYRKTTNCPIEL